MKIIPRLLLVLFSVCFTYSTVSAQIEACGPVPNFTLEKEVTEKINGDVDGRAKLLSKLLGDAGLEAAIETERKKIYQDNPNIVAQQTDGYLFYVTCVFLMQDKTLSSPQKIDELIKVKQSFKEKISSINVPQKFEELAKLNDEVNPDLVLDTSGIEEMIDVNTKYLGSGLIDHSQNMTAAAMQIAEK